MLDNILLAFGLNPSQYKIQHFGSGLINHTLKVSGNGEDYILQQINGNVFKEPAKIARNLALLQAYFKQTHPGYLFVAPLPSASGDFLVSSEVNEYYRLFPFVKGSETINFISDKKEAFEAAGQFGKFTRMLKDFDANLLEYSLADFHNLKLRDEQFREAHQNARAERLLCAADEIKEVCKHQDILQTYEQLMADAGMPVRVIHHDTKISNILFDKHRNGLWVVSQFEK